VEAICQQISIFFSFECKCYNVDNFWWDVGKDFSRNTLRWNKYISSLHCVRRRLFAQKKHDHAPLKCPRPFYDGQRGPFL